jgi:hypothetical protein
VNTDTKRVVVFDHITAQLEGDKLVVHNPTKFDPDVKVLLGNKAAASRPLGAWALKNARRLGGKAEVSVKSAQP